MRRLLLHGKEATRGWSKAFFYTWDSLAIRGTNSSIVAEGWRRINLLLRQHRHQKNNPRGLRRRPPRAEGWNIH